MHFKLIIIFFVFLTGCTSTKVHLYTKYLSENESQDITKELENNNFTVIENTLSIPEGIRESTIIYSPFLKSREDLNNTVDLLSRVGWSDIKLESLVKGNHWYGKNSFGLILIPNGLINKDWEIKKDLSHKYVGTNCDAQVEIELQDNNLYKITYTQKKQTKVKKGFWKVSSYPYLELSAGNGSLPMYFETIKRIEEDLIGKVNIIEIKPIQSYQMFSNCSFSYGLRN
ncbi:hypothetical protein [Thalassotalea profundi]|uniref:Lipoprotein n=1 Tax=Thalassotalea profundi TaxID=2036687 RepID=A0ABQ3IIQ8_9GAMM|nr:hypothetical protein [Thalassotalea profundi]GHE82980.1 hypothetical protein GCM10011501_09160 [Thalassotalea profundi]